VDRALSRLPSFVPCPSDWFDVGSLPMRFILVIVGESGCVFYDPYTNDTMFFVDSCSVAHDRNMNMKLLDEAWTGA